MSVKRKLARDLAKAAIAEDTPLSWFEPALFPRKGRSFGNTLGRHGRESQFVRVD